MSFNEVLMIVVIIVPLLIPVASFIAFYKGYSLGVKDWNRRNPDALKSEPIKKQPHFPTATDKELQKYRDILENIENYDGTAANQKEIH